MAMIQSMIEELTNEAATTRKLLERIPDDRLSWKPHEKSWSIGALASHIVNSISWLEVILEQDEFEIPDDYSPWLASSSAELASQLEEEVERVRRVMSSYGDKSLFENWTLKGGGQTYFSMPRIAVLRSFVLNHHVHHRGQLSVYLRLLDIPVPAMYGPSADEA